MSNLRRYIETLGGSLEITARFADASVTITNFGDLAKPRQGRGGQSSCFGSMRMSTPIQEPLDLQRRGLRRASIERGVHHDRN